jgi:hypothetical protein
MAFFGVGAWSEKAELAVGRGRKNDSLGRARLTGANADDVPVPRCAITRFGRRRPRIAP